MEQNDCIFCKIIKGEIPSIKLYEDENIFVFLDVNPINIGHSLVVPKKHFENLYDTPEKTLVQMIRVIKKISSAIKNSLGANGLNINMNNEKAAGQLVFHAHIHIIPRYNNDGYTHWHSKCLYKDGEMLETAKKIISVL